MANERIDLPQGTLDLLILKTLALEPQHGWAISERIQQISSDALQVQQGSLYPGLAPSGAARLDQIAMGHFGKQPARQVLRTDPRRTQAARE